MSNLKQKIDRILEQRGETFSGLPDRLKEAGFPCTLMTLYNRVSGATAKVPNGFFQTVANLLEVDYDELMDPLTDSVEVHTATLMYVDRSTLGPLLLKVIACPEASDEDRQTAMKHIDAWLQGEKPKIFKKK